MRMLKLKILDSNKAQEICDLLECIGADKPTFNPTSSTHLFLEGDVLYYLTDGDEDYFNEQSHTEITYEDLLDMVAMKDNSKDIATHFLLENIDSRFYITKRGGVVYFYNEDESNWVLSGVRKSELEPIERLREIAKSLTEMELISGLFAFDHVVKGSCEVQWARKSQPTVWRDYEKSNSFSIECLTGDDYLFRLKEKTFMIGDMEVPLPVSKPEWGKVYWFIDGYTSSKGYERAKWDNTEFKFPLACWDSEKKIKKVVKALSKLLQPQEK